MNTNRSITGFLLNKSATVDDGMVIHAHVYKVKMSLIRRSKRKMDLSLINYDRKHVGFYVARDSNIRSFSKYSSIK